MIRWIDRHVVVQRAVFGVVAIALAVALLTAVTQRQPGGDEFYTFYVAQPGFGVGNAFLHHWLVDNHPPLYYGLVRATAWLGETIEARRLLNLLLGFAAFASGMLVVRHARHLTSVAVVFFLWFASQELAVSMASYLRSYFLSLSATGLLILCLAVIWMEEKPVRGPTKIIFPLAVLFAVNTHVITAFISEILLAMFAAAALLRGRRAVFEFIAMPALISTALLVLCVSVQAGYWAQNVITQKSSLGFAIYEAKSLLRHGFVSNPVISATGLAGCAGLAIRALRQRTMPRELEIVILLAAGGIVAAAPLIFIPSLRFTVGEGYLIGLVAPIAMIWAIGVGQVVGAVGSRPAALIMLACGIASIWALWLNTGTLVRQADGWPDAGAKLLAVQATKCPGTVIHIVSLGPEYYEPMDGRDAPAAMVLALRMAAQRHGMKVAPASSREIAAGCPTLFWFTADPRVFTVGALREDLLRRGFAVPRLVRYRVLGDTFASTAALPEIEKTH